MRKVYEREAVTDSDRSLAARASKAYRRASGLTQSQLAATLGCQQTQVSWMERGLSNTPGRIIAAMLSLVDFAALDE